MKKIDEIRVQKACNNLSELMKELDLVGFFWIDHNLKDGVAIAGNGSLKDLQTGLELLTHLFIQEEF